MIKNYYIIVRDIILYLAFIIVWVFLGAVFAKLSYITYDSIYPFMRDMIKSLFPDISNTTIQTADEVVTNSQGLGPKIYNMMPPLVLILVIIDIYVNSKRTTVTQYYVTTTYYDYEGGDYE